jgi:hypothetical protein
LVARSRPVLAAGQNADNGLDDIVDEREVTAQPAKVIEVYGSTAHDRIDEFEDGHIRPAPWTVDGKESQSGGWDLIEVAIGVG